MVINMIDERFRSSFLCELMKYIVAFVEINQKAPHCMDFV